MCHNFPSLTVNIASAKHLLHIPPLCHCIVYLYRVQSTECVCLSGLYRSIYCTYIHLYRVDICTVSLGITCTPDLSMCPARGVSCPSTHHIHRQSMSIPKKNVSDNASVQSNHSELTIVCVTPFEISHPLGLVSPPVSVCVCICRAVEGALPVIPLLTDYPRGDPRSALVRSEHYKSGRPRAHLPLSNIMCFEGVRCA